MVNLIGIVGQGEWNIHFFSALAPNKLKTYLKLLKSMNILKR